MLCQLVVMFMGQSYQDILKRGYYTEFTKTAKHVLMVMLLSVLYLFATQQAATYSRLTLFYTAFLYLCFDYAGRIWRKKYVLRRNATGKKEKSMVVVVSTAEAEETIRILLPLFRLGRGMIIHPGRLIEEWRAVRKYTKDWSKRQYGKD